MELEINNDELGQLGSYELVDIRTDEEVAREPLTCDHIHIPMDRLLADPQQLSMDKVYVLVCAAGMRTRYAAEAFRNAGYKQIYSLIGGNKMLGN